LDNADDFGGAVTLVSGNNVTLNDINDLTVGGSLSGTLTTTAGAPQTLNALNVGGNLASRQMFDQRQRNVIVDGTTSLTAGSGNDITLDNADDFGGAVDIVSGHNVVLNDINGLTVGGTVSGTWEPPRRRNGVQRLECERGLEYGRQRTDQPDRRNLCQWRNLNRRGGKHIT